MSIESRLSKVEAKRSPAGIPRIVLTIFNEQTVEEAWAITHKDWPMPPEATFDVMHWQIVKPDRHDGGSCGEDLALGLRLVGRTEGPPCK